MNKLLISVIFRDILEINRELAIIVSSVGKFKDEVTVAALNPVLHPPLHFNPLIFSTFLVDSLDHSIVHFKLTSWLGLGDCLALGESTDLHLVCQSLVNDVGRDAEDHAELMRLIRHIILKL